MAPTIRTAASYSTHKEYTVEFFGEELIVTLTNDSSVISQWIDDVLYYNSRRFSSHPLVVGVGVQWTPPGYFSDSPPAYNDYADSSPESDYYAESPPPPERCHNSRPPVDTLQLCVGNRCIIIQLSHCYCVPVVLHSFVGDRETTFVGVYNGQDARRLHESEHQLVIWNLLNLRKYVVDSQGRHVRGRCSFEEIVEVCLGRRGVRLDRTVSMSDWSAFNLCDDQILQASVEAFVCCKLGVLNHLWEV
ncbi:unnamed protein product [Arabis nemorensis]|uniref:3'-5' exonuclease domain-containing protein n=1 Tax=Arabis nemorensis TaxID=586526 RepID=A0A565B6U3_9BRAS|nr:unnamed protein product [Arabis nemorensis]